MEQRNDSRGILLVLVAAILWGTVGPAQVLARSPAGPAALGGVRILTGGAILAAVVLATAPRSFRTITPATWPPLAAASAATAIFQVAFLTSVDRTGVAVATAVSFGVVPVSTGVCERLVSGVPLTRRWTVGTACAIAGCALVTAPDGPVRVDLLGVAFGVVAGGCFGVYTVAAKRLIQGGTGMIAAASVTLLAGGAVLTLGSLPALPALATPRSLALAAWLGPVTAAAAYLCFVTGLRRITAATAGTLALVEPLVAGGLALMVLGERLSAPVAAGSLVLLTGLVIVSMPAGTVTVRTARRPGRP